MADPSVTIELLMEDEQLRTKLAHALRDIHNKMKPLKTRTTGWLSAFSKLGNIITGLRSLAGILARIGSAVIKIGTALAKFGMATAEAADDVDRANWKFGLVFEDNIKQAENMANEIAKAYNRHESTIKITMAKIGDYLNPQNLDPAVVTEISAKFAELAQTATEWTQGQYDAAAAGNAFSKALVGEREMLKEMGVALNDQIIKEYLEEMGAAFTQQNLAIATYNLTLQKSQKLQKGAGDRLKSFSERLYQLSEAWKGLKEAIGRITEPILNSLVVLANTAIAKLEEWVESPAFNRLREWAAAMADDFLAIADAIANIDVSNFEAELDKIMKPFKQALSDAFQLAMTTAVDLLLMGAYEAGKIFGEGAANAGWKILESIGDTASLGLTKAIDDAFTSGAKKMAAGLDVQAAAIVKDAMLRIRAAFPGPERRKDPTVFEAEEMELMPLDLEKLKKATEAATPALSKLATSSSRLREEMIQLQAERKRLMEKEVKASLVGLREMYRGILTGAAGVDRPEKEIAKNTKEMARVQKEAKDIQKAQENVLKEIRDRVGIVPRSAFGV